MTKLQNLQDIYHDCFFNKTDKTNCTLHGFTSSGEKYKLNRYDFFDKGSKLTLFLSKTDNFSHNIGIMGKSSPYWLLIDFSIVMLGCTTVPFFENMSYNNFSFQVCDSRITTLFILDSIPVDFLEKIPQENILLKNIIFSKTVYQSQSEGSKQKISKIYNIYIFEDIINSRPTEKIQSISDFPIINKIFPDSLCSIIYTSGTTSGKPKGVKLSHRNFTSQVHDITLLFSNIDHTHLALSYLPLSHAFQRTILYFLLSRKASIVFVSDIQQIVKTAQEFNPTVMSTVPRLLEKIETKITEKINNEKNIFKHLIGKYALKKAYNSNFNSVSLLKTILHHLVYKKITQLLGNRMQVIISGGSALNTRLEIWLNNIGFPIYQGYGLTEAGPVISTNYPQHNKIGTVGKCLPSMQATIDKTGQLLVKGPNIMMGYNITSDMEDESIILDGQWLQTGDLGYFNAQGYLTLTGRKKELVKMSTGKYVQINVLEQKILNIREVNYTMVIAENQKFVSCLIFIDPTPNKEYLVQKVMNDIDKINSLFNHWQQIKKFKLIEYEPNIDDDTLTYTMKLKRGKLMERFSDVINDFYQSSSQSTFL